MIVILLIRNEEGTGIWLSGSNDILSFESFEHAEEILNMALNFYKEMTSISYTLESLSKLEIRALQIPNMKWIAEYLADKSLKKYTVKELAPLQAGKIGENGLYYWDVAERVPIHLD